MARIQMRYPSATRCGYSTTTLEAVVLALMSVFPVFTMASGNRGSFTASRFNTEMFGSVARLSVVRPRIMMDVIIPPGGAAAGTQFASSRSVLHASHRHKDSPTCPQCWLFSKYQGFFYGHCKSMKQLRQTSFSRFCFRSKQCTCNWVGHGTWRTLNYSATDWRRTRRNNFGSQCTQGRSCGNSTVCFVLRGL